jgi:nucleotide-binding universal stress UspA family protein
VDKVVTDFDGALALVMVGNDKGILSEGEYNILVPVNGTEASRNGAEMAFALSSSRKSKITALHVAERAASSGAKRGGRRSGGNRRNEKAVLEDTTKLAKRYGYDRIKTAVHVDMVPEEAILQEAQTTGANLIVIGASRRVGDHLFLGQTVACTLKNWKGAIVLVVS